MPEYRGFPVWNCVLSNVTLKVSSAARKKQWIAPKPVTDKHTYTFKDCPSSRSRTCTRKPAPCLKYGVETWKKGHVHISAQRVSPITGKEPRHQCPIEFTVFHACTVSQYISNKIQLKYPVDTALEKDEFDDDLSEPCGWGLFSRRSRQRWFLLKTRITFLIKLRSRFRYLYVHVGDGKLDENFQVPYGFS